MRAFEYTRPATIDDALRAAGRGARPLAGGTDLLTLMQAQVYSAPQLVDIKRVLRSGVSATPGGGVSIGALTPLADLERLGQYAALAEAARLSATPQLRNMATLGGNLLQRPRCWYYRKAQVPCWLKGGRDCPARDGENRGHALFYNGPCVAVHPSDPASALLALDASVRIRGARGERTLALAELMREPEEGRRTETTLAQGELIVSIELPPAAGVRSTYLKAMDRKAWAFALVGVAGAARRVQDRLEEVRLVLSGVAPVPRRVVVEPSSLAQASEAVLEGARPLAHNGYKVDLARALIRQVLQRVTAA